VENLSHTLIFPHLLKFAKIKKPTTKIFLHVVLLCAEFVTLPFYQVATLYAESVTHTPIPMIDIKIAK
jgi:hypothetical protein